MNARAAFSRSEAALEYRPVPTLDGSHAWHWVLLALPHRTCLGTGTAPNRAKAGTQARLKARQVGRRIAEIRIAGGALKEGKLPVAVSAKDFIMQGPARRKCTRCGTWLDAEDYCEDEACPFSDHLQDCRQGWAGHPKCLSHRGVAHASDCTCGGRTRLESVDPKNFIMAQPKGEDTPCGEPCVKCGKPCTLVHRGTGRDSLVPGEHICQTCDYNRFAGMLPENVDPKNIDPKDFILQQQPGPDTPCGNPCARCGKPCTLVHRGNLVPGEHICGACATLRFNQQLIGDLAPVRIADLHYHGHMESVREELPTDPTKVAAKDFILAQQTPEERLSAVATQGQKSYDCQLFSFKKTWPTAIDQVSVVINLYKNSSPGTVTTWIKLYTLTGGLINAEEDEHCYQDQDECLDRLIPILQQIKASEKPLGPDEVRRKFKPLFDWMYQTSGKI